MGHQYLTAIFPSLKLGMRRPIHDTPALKSLESNGYIIIVHRHNWIPLWGSYSTEHIGWMAVGVADTDTHS